MEMNARIGIPYIVTVHAYDIFTQFDSKDLKTKLMKAEKVITCSQYNRNYLIDLLGDEVNQKLLVQPYGINVSRFDYPNRQPGEHVRVLFVGRLVPKKGVFDVLDAFGHVIEQFPSTELRIAGDGPLLEQAVQRVERSQLKDKVVFLGGLTQNDVIKEMKSADIFILPSKTAPDGDKEGLPVVILEAQAMGLPVVSTLHTGIPEEVLDGETAFLVPEGDVRSMADCLCRLIEEPDLRMQMGKRGREWVENRFNHKLELDNLEKIMLDVVSSRESSINKRINYYFPQVLEHLESQNPFRDWRRYFFRANRYLRKKAKKVIRFLNEQS
jgi:glycosyltransferase involved in cell wall biosynthesis